MCGWRVEGIAAKSKEKVGTQELANGERRFRYLTNTETTNERETRGRGRVDQRMIFLRAIWSPALKVSTE